MTVIAGIGFAAPWVLAALVALPVLWLILRAIPPAPKRVSFAGVTLLKGLKDDEAVSARTPWWLLLLRMLAVAAVIVGLAGPVLNPRQDGQASGPLVLVLDASWAGAPNWSRSLAYLERQLDGAGQAARPVALLSLTDPQPLTFQSAADWAARLPGLTPRPWQPSEDDVAQAIAALSDLPQGAEVVWISDGLSYGGHEDLIQALGADAANLRAVSDGQPVYGLRPAQFRDGLVVLGALRSIPGPAHSMTILVQGRDPAGIERLLASADVSFAKGETLAEASLSLPSELRARISRFELAGQVGAGAVTLADDSLRRREIALYAGRDGQEGLELLSPLHYLRRALEPTADLIDGPLLDVLPANPDVVILADVATLAPAEAAALQAWVEKGGLLLRFAGPRLAASDVSRAEEDPLMPVRLRVGGRSVGGAMSWGEPKTLAPFADSSPFFGLPVPDEVTVSSQVMAQPDPTLADRVIAQLADGTPLVTRKPLGQGAVVLVHVTANAEWSSLPLSVLFVQMLERLSVSTSAQSVSAEGLEGTTWRPISVLDGFGRLQDAGALPGVAGPELAEAPIGPNLRPGLYENEDRRIARNVLSAEGDLTPIIWPSTVTVEGLGVEDAPRGLAGMLLSAALILLAADVLATLALSGRLFGAARMAAVVLGIGLVPMGDPASAQGSLAELEAANQLALAHVLTGDAALDERTRAGLAGLSDTLSFRTSVEPGAPVGVDLERDELAFYPLLYWPVSVDQPIPSDEAYARLNTYLRSGGMIIFDTRDADIVGYGGTTPEARKLQELAWALDIPPLEPLPDDHVLTRAFYLLQEFPGRQRGGPVWVEAAPPDVEQIEGVPFRNLNDGVTPVVIGSNDWASAWAVDRSGQPLVPVGRGFAGERQRELAHRFGVNLVMHVLSGNYKSDQVHVPALLERLGQ